MSETTLGKKFILGGFGVAAGYLGLSRRGLQKLHYADRGPAYYRLNRKILFSTSDLDRWLEQHRHEPQGEHVANETESIGA